MEDGGKVAVGEMRAFAGLHKLERKCAVFARQYEFFFLFLSSLVEQDLFQEGLVSGSGQTQFLAYLYSRRQQEAWRIQLKQHEITASNTMNKF